MKIRLQDRLSGAQRNSAVRANRREAGDSFAKLLTGIAILSVAATGLYGALTPAYRVIRSTRENLRASQLVMQKAETLSLITPGQAGDTNNYSKPLFVESSNPRRATCRSAGVQYAGYLSPGAPAASKQPGAVRSPGQPVTVTLCWTNFDGGKPIVQQREVQARLAPNGAPKYLWGAL